MKTLLMTALLLLATNALASKDYTCRDKKRTAISCDKVANKKRTHLCVKNMKKFNEDKKVKWCQTAKKKKVKKLSLN